VLLAQVAAARLAHPLLLPGRLRAQAPALPSGAVHLALALQVLA